LYKRPHESPRLSDQPAKAAEPTGALASEGELPSDMQPVSVRRGFTWTLVSNVVFALSQWGILAVLAKSGSQQMVGQFALGLAISTPLFMFAGLELRILLATDRTNAFSFKQYLSIRLVGGLLALSLATGIAYWNYPSATAMVVVAVSFGKLVELVADTFHGLLQSYERMDHVSRSTLMHGVVSCAFLAAAIVITQSVFVATMMAAVGRLLILLVYDIGVSSPFRALRISAESTESNRLSNDSDKPAPPRNRLTLAILGAPLAIKVLLISLNNNAARYFVAAYCGLAGLGLFVPVTAVATAGTSITRALNQAVATPLAACRAVGDFAAFRVIVIRLLCLYTVIGVIGISIASAFGDKILTFLFRAEYAAYAHVLVLAMIAATVQFLAGILDLSMITLRRVNVLVPLSCVTLGLVTLTCWLWVPTYGMSGAAAALSVSRLPRLFAMAWIVWRETKPQESEHACDAFTNAVSKTQEQIEQPDEIAA
jgi:O-antigen/teichoic acid export membrane protein